MTGRDVLNKALQLLNYTDSQGDLSALQNADIYKRGPTVINAILADVQHASGGVYQPVASLDDPLPVEEETAARVMPWGVAMLIAQGEGDGDDQQAMADNYNRLRGSLPRPTRRIADVLPHPWVEE